LEFSYVNTSRIQDIEEAVKENTKAFFIETPQTDDEGGRFKDDIAVCKRQENTFDCGQYFNNFFYYTNITKYLYIPIYSSKTHTGFFQPLVYLFHTQMPVSKEKLFKYQFSLLRKFITVFLYQFSD